ncbi:MAG: hypothetical protein ABJP34_03675 [Erythrobacter sp.]
MRFLRLLAVLFAFLAAPVAAQSSPFGDVAAMDDAELADERGGFLLPGGIDLDMVIAQETSIDGELVLRSSYVLAEGAPIVSIEHVSQGVLATTEGNDTRMRVTIEVPGTEVSHLMGRATGSVIANTADNRTISTITTVDLDLSRMDVGSIGSLQPNLGLLALETASFGF